jgi:hypothetical protein
MCGAVVLRGVVHGVTNTFAEFLVHTSDRPSCKPITKDLSPSSSKHASTAARWVISLMLGHFNCLSDLSIGQIIAVIAQHVDVLRSEETSDLLISILLSEVVSLFVLFIPQVDNVVGCSTLVGVTNLILIRHLIDSPALSLLFVLHVFPPFKVTFILLNPKQQYFKLKRLITYLFESTQAYFLRKSDSLLTFSLAAKSRLNLSFSGKKWLDVGSGAFTRTLSTYL